MEFLISQNRQLPYNRIIEIGRNIKKATPKKPTRTKKGTISFKKPSCALGMFPHLGGFHCFLFLFCVNQKAFALSSDDKKVLIIEDIQKPNIVHFTVKLNFLIKKRKKINATPQIGELGHTLT